MQETEVGACHKPESSRVIKQGGNHDLVECLRAQSHSNVGLTLAAAVETSMAFSLWERSAFRNFISRPRDLPVSCLAWTGLEHLCFVGFQ